MDGSTVKPRKHMSHVVQALRDIFTGIVIVVEKLVSKLLKRMECRRARVYLRAIFLMSFEKRLSTYKYSSISIAATVTPHRCGS